MIVEINNADKVSKKIEYKFYQQKKWRIKNELHHSEQIRKKMLGLF